MTRQRLVGLAACLTLISGGCASTRGSSEASELKGRSTLMFDTLNGAWDSARAAHARGEPIDPAYLLDLGDARYMAARAAVFSTFAEAGYGRSDAESATKDAEEWFRRVTERYPAHVPRH